MRMRIIEVSEDLYNRLHRISLLNNLEIKGRRGITDFRVVADEEPSVAE